MEITRRELTLALAIAAMGFIFSAREWVFFLNTLTPFSGFLVYYAILYVSLYILGKMDLVVFGFKIDDPLETLGLLLIGFAFFATINSQSGYIQIITGGSVANISPIFLQSEDGVLWWLWYNVIGVTDLQLCRYLAFSVSTFVIALLGLALVSKKVSLNDSL